MLLIRTYLIIFAFHTLTAHSELSTIERIKKHQEWLRQRGLLKPLPSRKFLQIDDLWKNKEPTRSPWQKIAEKVDDPRKNDVYPENDTTTIPTPTTSTTTTRRSTSTIEIETPTTSTQRPSTTVTTLLTTNQTTASAPTSTTVMTITTTTPSTTTAVDTTTTATIPTPTTVAEEEPPTTTTTTTPRPKSKLRPYPRWSPWSQWSECSRTCGGGVMWQQRKCISKRPTTGKRYISNDCIGKYRRYHLCNVHHCPSDDDDFRQQQCSAFDDVDFQGKKYVWEPYIKDDAECELNCKPMGMKYFATLNNTVVDGTTCFRPAEYYRSNYRGRAICVGGICKAVHSSGVITGLSANSGTVGCGGLICRPVTGIFTRNPLPEDAYIQVAIIPAGASNISITELKNSINLLVLRTSEQKYLFNGDNTESPNGAYEGAGAVFDYRRIDGLQDSEGVTEWITSTGPIREVLELMVYSRDVNPGIKYEYLLPIGSDSEENEVSIESDINLKSGNEDTSIGRPRRRKFNWKVVGFSTCSKSCGGGTQVPDVRCVRENPSRNVPPRRCNLSEKPVLNENLLRCNTQPCPAFWRMEEWGECACTLQQAEGEREREVNCVQELANGIVIQVNNAACLDEEPPAKKPCECPKPSRRRNHHRHRNNYNGRLQNSIVRNSTSALNNRRVIVDKEKAGTWLISDWNNFCSAPCGPGVEHRSIFCDRSKPNTERCDARMTPDATRPCERELECVTGDWFAGPWSNCTGSCFNLVRSRQVLCIQNQLIVDDEDCKVDDKPETAQKCKLNEVEYCSPRWHYSAWSECTKTCDGGTQRRKVRCLEFDEAENTLRESSQCRYSQREPIYRSCNSHKCVEPRVDLIQNDIAPSCADEFSNCHLVVKAKLCSYEYYQQNCCYSCGAEVV